MSVYDDLEDEVAEIFEEVWTTRDGQKVPEPTDIKLGNEAVKLDGTVLYTDLSGSTRLVDRYKAHFAAEIYKTFLYCAAKVIRSKSGVLTSYDGDRVMGVFIGGSKNTNAAKAALGINYAVSKIINPALKKQYPRTDYVVRHTTGVDTSALFVARTGIRGSNDLVWVGRAANHAAKLSSSDFSVPSVITEEVYNSMGKDAKLSGDGAKNRWVRRTWSQTGRTVYTSTWWWSV